MNFHLYAKLSGGWQGKITATETWGIQALKFLQHCTSWSEKSTPDDGITTTAELCLEPWLEREVPEGFIAFRGCGIAVESASLSTNNPQRKRLVRIRDFDRLSASSQGRCVRQLFFLTLLPALQSQLCCVVHGGLAQDCQTRQGIMFCGPSGMGKSTTMGRLGREFQVFSDDCVLLSQHGENVWYAQGVPTWSIWIYNKAEQLFDCNRSVRLGEIYLLERGESQLIPLERRMRLPGIMSAFADMLNWYMPLYPNESKRALQLNAFEMATQIAATLPITRLSCHLQTDFEALLHHPPA